MLGSKFDAYTMRARVAPALLVALPVGLATLAWFPGGIVGWATVWGLVAWSGGTILLAQLGRDAGKRKELKLFRLWGGKPTTRMLRHRDASNKVLLLRRHKKLGSLMRDVKLPTPDEEAADPAGSDQVYETCVTLLREKTRDTKRFQLVFDENCSYGFRRNLWGMKPLGLLLGLLAVGTIVMIPVVDPLVRSGGRLVLVVMCGGLNLVLFLLWVFVFKPTWVRVPAEAYAERLLEACERL